MISSGSLHRHEIAVTGWYVAGLIGLNQGLTKAGEEVVGTMNTVRCNH